MMRFHSRKPWDPHYGFAMFGGLFFLNSSRCSEESAQNGGIESTKLDELTYPQSRFEG